MEYTYAGVDKQGKSVTGSVEAVDESRVRAHLRTVGVRPTRISKANNVNITKYMKLLTGGDKPLPTEIMVVFTRQLHTLITSGIPMVQAIETLADQADNPNLKKILTQVHEKISSGGFFWEALANFPQAFPKLFVSLVKAGEASGAIDTMLKRLGKYMEDADRLKKLLKSAMMYPIIVSCIGVGVVSLMLIFVIPKFEEMLKDGGQELPAPTAFVINLSHFLVDNIILILIGMFATYILATRFYRSPEGQKKVQKAVFKLPLFGPIAQKGGTARFSRTLGTLLASGVNILDALDICKATIDNAVLEESVAGIRADIENGKTFTYCVAKIPHFPRMAVQMMSVGESTGNLDKMLERVADFYENEVETLINGLTKLIEPITLVVLGGAVGGLLIAMYLPIFKMASGAGGG